MKSSVSNRATHWILLFILVFIWGSSFILMKRGLECFSAFEVGALRISISFIVLLPFALARLKSMTGRNFLIITITGILGNGFPAFFFAYAQTGLDSSITGILNSLTPLFTLVIGLMFFRIKTKWFNVLGIFIALTGTTLLLSTSGGHNLEFNIGFAFYVIIATLFYAININLIKAFLKESDSLTITSFAVISIGPPAILYLLFGTDFTGKIINDPGAVAGLGYIAILAVVGTAFALILYNKLIKQTSVVFAASVTYLIPAVAVLWGIADGEGFRPIYILWITLILVGVFLVNRNSNNNGKDKKTELK